MRSWKRATNIDAVYEQPQQAPPRQWTYDERRAALAQAVGREVALGARIESQADLQAVVVRGQRTNHLLHLILTLVTCGLWAVVWILLGAMGGESRQLISIDEWGNIQRH